MTTPTTAAGVCQRCWADLPATEAGRSFVTTLHDEDWEFNPATNDSIEATIAAIEAEARAEADAQITLRILTLWEALEAEERRLVGMADRYAGPGPGSVGSLVDLQNVYGSFEVLRRVLADTAPAEEARDG